MTFTEFAFKVIYRVGILRRIAQSIIRKKVLRPGFIERLNRYYKRFNSTEREMFCLLFASIYKNRTVKGISANWSVFFCGKEIIIPLHPETFWLDWNIALSIMGHDLEVKECYEYFIVKEKIRNKVFFDIGANYGTHSVLFLSNNFKTLTFEPNPECWDKFNDLTKANNLKGELLNFAIGEKAEEVDLVFPKNDTWMGSISKNYQDDLSGFSDITSVRTKVIRLDDFVTQTGIYPGFVKIDTEGFELSVLRGGKNALLQSKPIIVFESNKSSERESLYTELTGMGYDIFDIRNFTTGKAALNKVSFVESRLVNFVSVHNEYELN